MVRIRRGTAVVLDLDDTLFSERDFLVSGFRRVARLVSEDSPGELLRQMLSEQASGGDPLGLAASTGRFSSAELLDLYRTHQPDISLYEDAARFLQRCRAVGTRPVLVTDGRSVTQRNKMRALGVEPFIAGAVISEEMGVGKPDVAVFLAAAAMVPAASYVYLADNPRKDFLGPRELGWSTVMMRDRGTNVHSQAIPVDASMQAEEVAMSFDEVEFV